MALQPVTVANFAAGVDTKSRQQALAEGAVREAVNVDIIRGKPCRAAGYSQISGLPGGHSLWSWPGFPFALMVTAAGELLRIDADLSSTVVALPGNFPMSYAELGGTLYASNGIWQGRITGNGQFEQWGMDAPPPPLAGSMPTGGMVEGDYQLAYVGVMAGEESPASRVATVSLQDGQGIQILDVPTAAGIDSVNLYMSDPNGTELYFYRSLLPGSPSVEIGGSPRTKRILADLEAERFPAGPMLASWHRCLLSAVDNVLRFTRVRQASLWRPSEDWYQFEAPITFLGPVLDGVYVGTTQAVYFLAGDQPEGFQRILVDNHGALHQPLQSYVPATLFGGQPASGNLALWWSTEGEQWIGRNGGQAGQLSPIFALPEIGQAVRQFYWRSDGTERLLSSIDVRGGRFANPITSPNIPVGTA